MDEIVLITSMANLVILAAFLSIVMHKIKFPPLIGFLMAGIIIANFVHLPEDSEEVVEILSNLGLIMLMFSIGMEIDIRKLRTQGRFALIVACVQLPLMVVGGVVAGMLMGYDMLQSICLGCIISGSSTAVVLAVLKSQGKLGKEDIDTIILVVIMEDIGQVIMLSILTPMLSGSEMNPDALITLILQIAIFMVACFTLGLKIVPKVIDWFYKRSNDELISLLCIGALFILSWAATKMGLSVAIGAFLMGVIVAMSRPKDAVEHFVDPLKSLFMAMFFISVGMEVALSSLVDNILPIIIIFLVFALCKTATVYLGYWIGNGNMRVGLVSAMGLCAMGEFAFIIAKQALDYGVVDQSYYSAVIGAALISMVLLPVTTKYSDKIYDLGNEKSPQFLKNIVARCNNFRDEIYAALETLSMGTKSMFKKSMTNVYGLIFIIIAIQLIFYFIDTPLVEWMNKTFVNVDQRILWMCLVGINFLAQAYPCTKLMSSIRLMLHILAFGKENMNSDPRTKRIVKRHESINPLLMGGSLAILVIILTPEEMTTPTHIAGMAAIMIGLLIYQGWKIHTQRMGAPLPNIEDAEKEE